MWTRTRAVLLTLILLTACGDDPAEPRYAAIEDARLRILAGDGQSAPVATAEARAGDLVPGAYTLAQTAVEDQYDLFPEVLEVVLAAEQSLTGTGGDPVAPGTSIHWIVRDEGCGRPVGQTTVTDQDGRSLNRWIRGTVARTCHLDVCRILPDGALGCDTTFNAVQRPGPVKHVGVPLEVRLTQGDRWAGVKVADQYNNPIDFVLSATGSVSAEGTVVTAESWGLGEIDALVDDTVVGSTVAYVFPDFAALEGWSAELVCTAPDTVYVDWFEFEIAHMDVAHWAPGKDVPSPYDHAEDAGLNGRYAGLVTTTGTRRLILAGTDTIYDTAVADTALDGTTPAPKDYPEMLSFRYGTGPFVVVADTTTLVWPSAQREPRRSGIEADRPFRLPFLQSGGAQSALEGIPSALPLVSMDPLTWSAGDAIAACHSNGWTSATSGAWTVRAGT